jgi:16S rRNA (adenine1518-N6/adenine1519-N6)-dimethyltransferase
VEAPQDLLFRLIRTAFGTRRKTLRRSLAGLIKEPEKALAAAGIDPTRRPETLVLEDFAALARAVAAEPRGTSNRPAVRPRG